MYVREEEKEAKTYILITTMTCTSYAVRAINAIGKEADIPAGLTRKGMTEGAACKQDEHLIKMKEQTSSHRMLNITCQVPCEHSHKPNLTS